MTKSFLKRIDAAKINHDKLSATNWKVVISIEEEYSGCFRFKLDTNLSENIIAYQALWTKRRRFINTNKSNMLDVKLQADRKGKNNLSLISQTQES